MIITIDLRIFSIYYDDKYIFIKILLNTIIINNNNNFRIFKSNSIIS